MTFSLNFRCDNAAFDLDPKPEIARILRDIANAVENGQYTNGTCRDVNGNVVGQFQLKRSGRR